MSSTRIIIPKLIAVIDSSISIKYDPVLNGIIHNRNSYFRPKAVLVKQDKSSTINLKAFTVMRLPTKKGLHNDLDITFEVGRKTNVTRDIATITFEIPLISREIEAHPYIVYHFTERETLTEYPFITYIKPDALNVYDYPFITHYDSTFGSGGSKVQWYLNLYSNKAQKVVRCKMYDSSEGFPLRNCYLEALCKDGKRRFVPLDRVDSDFDSAMRVQDKYGNDYQICVERQENIINKYFSYGDLLIPLTNYDDLYHILVGIFGTARVKMADDASGVYFTPPDSVAGITKLLAVGLNIKITNIYGVTFTTYNNGLNMTSYGGDEHWKAHAMLIKFHKRQTFKIQFKNDYYGTSYTADAIVKNALVIGTIVESMSEQSSSYDMLIKNQRWYLFDVPTNYIHMTNNYNKIVSYFIKQYLLYPHSGRMYNYYDLAKFKLQDDLYEKNKQK